MRSKTLIIILLIYAPVFGQGNNWQVSFEELAESITSRTETDIDHTSLLEQLRELKAEPAQINSGEDREIERLILLNDFQKQALKDYINENGAVLSPGELQFIYGFDLRTAKMAEPFIDFSIPESRDKPSLRSPLREGRHQLFLRAQRVLETREGYIAANDSTGPDYPGSPWKLYTRYAYSYKKKLLLGFTAEKDAGEEITGNYGGFDFYSGFVQLNDAGIFRTIVIGDYEPRFGQGLNLWSGFSFGKSTQAMLVEKRQSGIRKYSSTNENRFFRGIATTIAIKDLEISTFFSSKRVDANITQSDSVDTNEGLITSFLESGIHATASQIVDRKNIKETIMGANLSYTKDRLHWGFTMVGMHYSPPVAAGREAYELYDFQGSTAGRAGGDYKLNLSRASIFGEISITPEHNWAFIQGGLFPLSDRLSLSALYRWYQPGFIPVYSNAFSENSSVSNEKGFYLGIKADPLPKWRLTAYLDIFSFPWLKYRVSAPSKGMEAFMQAEYSATKDLDFYLRMQYEKKQEDLTAENGISRLADREHYKGRLHFSFKASPTLELRNRLELSAYKKAGELSRGYMAYQDIIFRPPSRKADISFRFAVFETDSYASRIYAYENDVLYAFSIPSYYGRGNRSYLLLHSAISDHLDLWFRISRTIYSDRQEIGTGPNQLEGNHITELKVQARLKF